MVIVLSLLVVGACQPGDKTAMSDRTPPAPGGGEHRITSIMILDRENGTLLQNKNRQTLRVGEKMPLRVMASWLIPYVGDETDKAKLTVSDPAVAELDSHVVLTARKPGKVVITAVLRVADGAGGHEVLDYAAPAAGVKVIEFTDHIEMTRQQRED
jgi:alpha-mannosidase